MNISAVLPPPDRRRAARFAPNGAKIEILGRTCELSDISAMGMHARGAPETLSPGDVVVVTLLLPRRRAGRPPHRFALNAMVVSRTPAGAALRYLQPTRRWATAIGEYFAQAARAV